MIPIKAKKPTQTFPYVTIFLIVLNIFIFLLPITTTTRIYAYYKYGVIPALFLAQGDEDQYQDVWDSIKREAVGQRPVRFFPFGGPRPEEKQWVEKVTALSLLDPDGDLKGRFELLTLLSSLFLHGGLLHLVGNVLFLWVFGTSIEDACGHAKFAGFHILGGLIASVTQMAVSSVSIVPIIGASGAISGVLGAYLLLYPRTEVLTLVPIYPFMYPIELPAFVFLLYWILLQFVSGLPSLGRVGGGVAWFAHIGGFLAGLALIAVFKKRHIKFFG